MKNISQKLQTNAQRRLLEIYNLLAQGNSYKAQEFAEKFGCTRKTVSNDLKELVEDGVVKYEAHHYTMHQEYRLKYKRQNSDMLNTMMQSMLQKVMPQFVSDDEKLFYFDFEMEQIEDEAVFSEIATALTKKEAISFEYTTRSGVHSTKKAYPLKVSNFSGAWYLAAYDLEKESLRIYHMLDITNATLLEEDYLGIALRESLELEAKKIDSPWYGNPKKSAILKAEDLAILYIKRKRYNNIEILEENENSLILRMHYYQDTELLNFVKSWLPYISIINNPALQNQLKEILIQALEDIEK